LECEKNPFFKILQPAWRISPENDPYWRTLERTLNSAKVPFHLFPGGKNLWHSLGGILSHLIPTSVSCEMGPYIRNTGGMQESSPPMNKFPNTGITESVRIAAMPN
jgi:hypothetical protein